MWRLWKTTQNILEKFERWGSKMTVLQGKGYHEVTAPKLEELRWGAAQLVEICPGEGFIPFLPYPFCAPSSGKRYSNVRMKHHGSLGRRKNWRKSSGRFRQTWTPGRRKLGPCSSMCRRARRSFRSWSSSWKNRRCAGCGLHLGPRKNKKGAFGTLWVFSGKEQTFCTRHVGNTALGTALLFEELVWVSMTFFPQLQQVNFFLTFCWCVIYT